MTVSPSRSGWSRPYVVTLLVTLLLGCASACAADPVTDPAAEHAEALRVAAEDHFAAQDLVEASSSEVQAGSGNVVVTISVEPETSVEEVLTLINDAQADLAGQMAADPQTDVQVIAGWSVQGTPLTWWTSLDPSVDRDDDRLRLDFAVSRTGPTAESIKISSLSVRVSRGEYDQIPETLETSAPAELPPGIPYGQTLTVHGWLLEINLESGEDLSAVPLAELTTGEAGAESGNVGYMSVGISPDRGVQLKIEGLAGGMEPSSTTPILTLMDSCTGVVDSLVLSSQAEQAPGMTAYACSQGGLTPDADYGDPDNDPPLADRLLQEARSGQ